MPKRATLMVLSEQEQEELEQLTRRHRSEQQVVLRARIVRAAAQGRSNAQIARDMHVNVDTVRLWRDRWAEGRSADSALRSVKQRLQDVPRPGVAPTFTPEQRCQMAALACEAPAKAGRPMREKRGERPLSMDELRGVQALVY